VAAFGRERRGGGRSVGSARGWWAAGCVHAPGRVSACCSDGGDRDATGCVHAPRRGCCIGVGGRRAGDAATGDMATKDAVGPGSNTGVRHCAGRTRVRAAIGWAHGPARAARMPARTACERSGRSEHNGERENGSEK
jgi:hypothetical protein